MIYEKNAGGTRYERVRKASNPLTPGDELVALGSDSDDAVRASIICNPSPAILGTLVRKLAAEALQSSNWVLRQAVAASTRVTPDQHREVAASRHWYICIALVNNLTCPQDLPEEFAKDPEEGQPDLKEVRERARQRLDWGRP